MSTHIGREVTFFLFSLQLQEVTSNLTVLNFQDQEIMMSIDIIRLPNGQCAQ
jgi:hypothetical protein